MLKSLGTLLRLTQTEDIDSGGDGRETSIIPPGDCFYSPFFMVTYSFTVFASFYSYICEKFPISLSVGRGEIWGEN